MISSFSYSMVGVLTRVICNRVHESRNEEISVDLRFFLMLILHFPLRILVGWLMLLCIVTKVLGSNLAMAE